MNHMKRLLWKYILIVILIIPGMGVLVACSPISSDMGTEHIQDRTESNWEELDGIDHEDSVHEDEKHEHQERTRIPNGGASIRILSPNDSSAFFEGNEVHIKVEVDSFALGEHGNHWHVYIDGISWGMVVGGRTNEAIRGLEPGVRNIEVYLAGGDHIELEDGDSVKITIK